MHTGNAVPLVPEATPLADAIYEISSKKLGVAGVLNAAGDLAGVFTDGDLRRTIQDAAKAGRDPAKAGAALFARVGDVMTKNPKRIARGRLAVDALALMQAYKITSLFVFEDDVAKTPSGARTEALLEPFPVAAQPVQDKPNLLSASKINGAAYAA